MNYSTSETTATLFAALSVAQGDFAGAKKDAVNPAFRSKYADLAAVWDAVREHLTTNKLAIIQIPTAVANTVTVTTILTHASGEWISGELTIVSDKNTAQGLGSAITYARRYALSAFLGIAPEDDDGNEASRGKTDAPAAQKRQQAPPPPEPAASKDMKAAFAEMKTLLGDKLYGLTLKYWGCKEATELERENAAIMYKQMALARKVVLAATHGEVLPEMTPEIFNCLPDASVVEIMKEYRKSLIMLAGDEVGIEEYEDARRASTDQWDCANRLKMKVSHLAAKQGL